MTGSKAILTTKENSTIDYIITSPGLMGKIMTFDINVFDPFFSDKHKLITLNLKVPFTNNMLNISNINVNKNVVTNTVDVDSNNVYNIQQAELRRKQTAGKGVRLNWTPDADQQLKEKLFLSDIVELNDLSQVGIVDVDDLLKLFETKMMKLYNECNALKVITNKNSHVKPNKHEKPWFNKECEIARKRYHTVRRLVNRREHSSESLSVASKNYSKTIKKAISNYNKDFTKKLRKASKNPKEFWKLINANKDQNETSAHIDDLVEHFKKLNSDFQWDNTLSDNPDPDHIFNQDDLEKDFTEQEVKEAIKSLKNGKSPGEDMVLNEFVKESANHILPFYTNLFNTVLMSGEIPETWTTGIIVPIFKKKGDPRDPSNYRGVTLVSVLGKIFTKMLNDRLEKFSNLNEILLPNQAGFRKGHSTVDQVYVLQTLIELCIKQKRRLFIAWVDYAKAFDTVWRQALWFKLLKSGYSSKIVSVIKNMYANIKSKIRCNSTLSDSFVSLSGVRQGESLSPFLFALFINDFESFMLEKGSNPIRIIAGNDLNTYINLLLVLYADDTAIIADSPQNLQKGLDILYEYCSKWKLNVNVGKTKVTVFEQRKSVLQESEFYYNGTKLEVVQEFRYLGTTLSYNGSVKTAIKSLCEQARKAMYALLTKSRNLHIPLDLQIELFNRLVAPILTYSCEVWATDDNDIDEINKLQLKFLKFILKLKNGTATPMVYGETGEFPLNLITKNRIIGYFSKLRDPNNTTLAKKMFNVSMSMHNQGVYTTKWVQRVNAILHEIGYPHLLHSEEPVNKKVLVNYVKYFYRTKYIEDWRARMNNLSKCDTYVLFKVNFEKEKYLSAIDTIQAIDLCKYRTSNHKLEIEVLRYQRPLIARQDRKCRMCNLNEIGNEYHHLLICPKHDEYRTKFIPRKYTNRPNFVKFLNLVSCKSPKVMRNLSKFISITMKSYN